MGIRYIGRAFREQHHIGLRALARGTGLQNHTLIDLEQNRRYASTETVERIVVFFRQQGIECDLGDFLVYEEPTQETNGAQEPHG